MASLLSAPPRRTRLASYPMQLVRGLGAHAVVEDFYLQTAVDMWWVTDIINPHMRPYGALRGVLEILNEKAGEFEGFPYIPDLKTALTHIVSKRWPDVYPQSSLPPLPVLTVYEIPKSQASEAERIAFHLAGRLRKLSASNPAMGPLLEKMAGAVCIAVLKLRKKPQKIYDLFPQDRSLGREDR
ncbi:MAG: hypothetical protein AB7G80_03960 [Dongiaceae bacterium]